MVRKGFKIFNYIMVFAAIINGLNHIIFSEQINHTIIVLDGFLYLVLGIILLLFMIFKKK